MEQKSNQDLTKIKSCLQPYRHPSVNPSSVTHQKTSSTAERSQVFRLLSSSETISCSPFYSAAHEAWSYWQPKQLGLGCSLEGWSRRDPRPAHALPSPNTGVTGSRQQIPQLTALTGSWTCNATSHWTGDELKGSFAPALRTVAGRPTALSMDLRGCLSLVLAWLQSSHQLGEPGEE